MTLGDSELLTGLGLLMVLASAGLAVVLFRWSDARKRQADAAELSDGAVLIVEDGRVLKASNAAQTLLGPATGPVTGQPVRAMLEQFLGTDFAPALDALDGLEQTGDPIHLIVTNAAGQHYELAGRPHGGQLRLVLREAELLTTELGRSRAEITARAAAVAEREIETSTLIDLLAGAPVLAWNRTATGGIAWAEGMISTRHGEVCAAEAATIAGSRTADREEKAGSDSGSPSRFRLEVAQPGGSEPIALDVIEVAGTDGARLGLALDASGALAAERTLARFFRTMTETFAHLNVGLAIFDRNQALVLFNPALVEMWRADPAWLATRPSLREILDSMRSNRRIPEMADFYTWRRRLTRLFENSETADFEELWHLADGSDIRVLARPHPHGSLAFVFDDVTERLRLEQQYRHSIDLRRATLDRLDEGLVVFGPDGLLQLVNDAFHEIWGTDSETVRPTMHAAEIIPLVRGLTVETGVWDRLMTQVTGSGARQAWTARLTLGTGRIIRARFAALPDGSTMAVFSDVTDSERIAHALRERNEALEAVEEMRGAVLDRISHRLRTPLNTIFGFGQLIGDSRFGALNEQQHQFAVKILESARHLLAVVDDVTDLASLDLDAMQIGGEVPSLAETLMLTGQLLEKRATEEGVALRVAAPDPGLEPCCDAGRLRQIVFNMTTDAISRCRDGGDVEIGARRTADGHAEVCTAETRTDGTPFDPAAAESASMTLPFLRRLVAREGGVFELQASADGQRFGSVCRFQLTGSERTGADPDS